jgi:hypothetical protein
MKPLSDRIVLRSAVLLASSQRCASRTIAMFYVVCVEPNEFAPSHPTHTVILHIAQRPRLNTGSPCNMLSTQKNK